MNRTLIVLAAVSTLGFTTPRLAAAASPVTGTIACSATGELRFDHPFLPMELAEPNTRPLSAKIVNETSTCDDSGVVGADGGISTVAVSVKGKVAAETSCLDFASTVSYAAKVRLRWRVGRKQSTSRTTVASVTYDGSGGTDAFVLVTNPIEKGPFSGSTVTMRFVFGGTDYADWCSTHDYRITAFLFGPDFGQWTISVP